LLYTLAMSLRFHVAPVAIGDGLWLVLLRTIIIAGARLSRTAASIGVPYSRLPRTDRGCIDHPSAQCIAPRA
jgi:hypothetical protein